MRGLVIKSTGKNYLVKCEEDIFDCVIRGKVRLEGSKSTNPVAVGDYVDISDEGDIRQILTIHQRNNHLVRKSVNLSKQQHVIAANIDLAVLVICDKSPVTSFSFIDRFIVGAEAFGIEVMIVLNKADLLSKEELEEAKYKLSYYEDLDYETLIVSAESGLGLEEMKKALKDKTIILSGHSGVGKSTLLNEIQEGLTLRTGDISDVHDSGMHTTTNAEMIFTDFGSKIIDSPGIKGFGLVGIEKEEVKNYFKEFSRFSQDCHFHNCQHNSEPKCAVKVQVEEGEIKFSRYESYLSMILNDDSEHFRQNIYG